VPGERCQLVVRSRADQAARCRVGAETEDLTRVDLCPFQFKGQEPVFEREVVCHDDPVTHEVQELAQDDGDRRCRLDLMLPGEAVVGGVLLGAADVVLVEGDVPLGAGDEHPAKVRASMIAAAEARNFNVVLWFRPGVIPTVGHQAGVGRNPARCRTHYVSVCGNPSASSRPPKSSLHEHQPAVPVRRGRISLFTTFESTRQADRCETWHVPEVGGPRGELAFMA
jgi:hypothetical protein